MKWLVTFVASMIIAVPTLAQDRPADAVWVADHIALNVADAEASAAFYQRTFDLQNVPTSLPNTRWMSLGNGLTLHLIGGRTVPVSPNRVVHFALRTQDLDKTIAYFDAAGIAWSDFTGKARSIQTRFDGVRQIFIQDPDGYWIEVSDTRGKRPR
jgi:lactoylglutathione lyase